MFKSLQPLLAERSIHILLSATKDGLMNVYVAPAKKDDKEDAAFTVPFQCTATAEELEAQLPDVLTKWVASRQVVTTDLSAALNAAEAAAKKAADEAKKKVADKGKKVVPATASKAAPTTAKPGAKPAAPVTPSLLDSCGAGAGTDEDDDDAGVGGEGGASASTGGNAGADSVAESTPAEAVSPPVEAAPSTPVAAAPAPLEAVAPVETPAAPVAAPAPAPTVAVVATAPVIEELF